MKVRDWRDIVEDVVDADADPDGWRAVAGDRSGGVGEDFYVGHHSAGVYLLKTYAKNPFEVRGVGTRVARRIDEDLESLFPSEDAGRFAVQQAPEDEREAQEKARNLETVLQTHADAPTDPEAAFEDVMDALESPAYGPMDYDQYGRPEGLDSLSKTFEDAEDVLDAEFEDIVAADEVDRGFQ